MSDILDAVYPTLRTMVNPDKVISESKTGEDILEDVCLRALRIYGDKDISFEEGKQYLLKGVTSEIYFGFKKIATDKLLYVENIYDYDKEEKEA